MKAQRRRTVDPDTDPAAKVANECLRRGLGFKAAAQAAGLTQGQVAYQAVRFGLSVRDYRSGISPESMALIAEVKRACKLVSREVARFHRGKARTHRVLGRVIG